MARNCPISKQNVDDGDHANDVHGWVDHSQYENDDDGDGNGDNAHGMVDPSFSKMMMMMMMIIMCVVPFTPIKQNDDDDAM